MLFCDTPPNVEKYKEKYTSLRIITWRIITLFSIVSTQKYLKQRFSIELGYFKYIVQIMEDIFHMRLGSVHLFNCTQGRQIYGAVLFFRGDLEGILSSKSIHECILFSKSIQGCILFMNERAVTPNAPAGRYILCIIYMIKSVIMGLNCFFF